MLPRMFFYKKNLDISVFMPEYIKQAKTPLFPF